MKLLLNTRLKGTRVLTQDLPTLQARVRTFIPIIICSLGNAPTSLWKFPCELGSSRLSNFLWMLYILPLYVSLVDYSARDTG